MNDPLHDPRTRASTVLEAWNGEAVDAGAVPVHPVARFRRSSSRRSPAAVGSRRSSAARPTAASS